VVLIQWPPAASLTCVSVGLVYQVLEGPSAGHAYRLVSAVSAFGHIFWKFPPGDLPKVT